MTETLCQMSDALLTLQRCREKLLYLDNKVENLQRLSSSSHSIPPSAPPPSPAVPATSFGPPNSMVGGRASPRCHECHGPIGEYHAKYPHGIGSCPLQHYDMCPGDISEGKDRGGHMWKGCPFNYLAPDASNYEDTSQVDSQDKSPSEFSYTSLKSLDKSYVPSREVSPAGRRPKTRSMETGVHTPLHRSHAGVETASPLNIHPSSSSEQVLPQAGKKGGLKEDLLLEAELAELAIAEDRLDKLKKARDRKQRVLEDFDRLSRQSQGEGAVGKKVLMETVDSIKAKNSQPELSRLGTTSYQGPSIDQMRRDPSNRVTVEQLMDGEVHVIPALSNANNRSQLGQPRLKTPHPSHNDHRRVNTLSQAARSPVTPVLKKETHYRWETGVDRYGVEYRSLVEVTPVKSPQFTKSRTLIPMEDGWVYDEELGRAYKKSSRQDHPPVQHNGQTHRFGLAHERYRTSSTPPRLGRPVLRSPSREKRTQSGTDRYPSRVYIESNPHTDREGKALSISDHARQLPLECARSVTSKNINFAMFMYGAIKELHSARIGATQPLEDGVMEAKLLNIIHVTCLNSTSADFKPTAWSVGRTYNNLVQSKVESGRESWLDFDQLHRGSPHAAEMVAAEREHRSALAEQLRPKRDPKKGDKGDKGDKSEKEKRPLCTTWNSSDVEGKCKWESEHPDTKCNRAHFCSYCEKKTGNTRTNHQESFCKRKEEGDK